MRQETDLTKLRSRVLVIIPAYNERECIYRTVQEVIKAGYDYIVINDGSSDDTLEVCKSSGINVLDLPINLGIGGAVQAGHKYALRHGYDIDIQFDGDGQHDARYLDALVCKVDQGADLVMTTKNSGRRLCGELERHGFHGAYACLQGCACLIQRLDLERVVYAV